MTKNYFISMQKGFLALMSAALLFSCSQLEPFEMEGNDRVLRSVVGNGNENARDYAETDCINPDFCIDPDNPVYSMQTSTISNNAGPQTRVFTYTVYNTLTGFELEWNYLASNNASRQLKITVSGAGFASSKTYTSNTVQVSGNGTSTFNFDASWFACGEVSIVAEILDENGVLLTTKNTTYNLIGTCGGCDESFTYVDNGNKTYTFTYTPDEDITDAALVFTFAQGTAISGLDESWTVNGQTRQKTMSLTSCTAYTWLVTLNGTCSGGQSSSNVWTDFKVNDVSKKNDPDDIFKQDCD